MKLKALSQIMLSAAIMLMLTGCGILQSSVLTDQSQFATYTSESEGYSIRYPLEWENQSDDDRHLRFVSPRIGDNDSFPESLSLEVRPYSAALVSQKDLEALAMKDLNTDHEHQVDASSADVFADMPAHRLFFSDHHAGSHFRMLRVVAVGKGKAYTFQFLAEAHEFEPNLPFIEGILDSFQLIE